MSKENSVKLFFEVNGNTIPLVVSPETVDRVRNILVKKELTYTEFCKKAYYHAKETRKRNVFDEEILKEFLDEVEAGNISLE